jgi:methyl-accepting chemotaxis protein
MVSSVQEDTSEAVDAIEQGQSEVESGIELAEQAADAFEEIVGSTGGITDRVDSIATATEEQAATGDQISESVQAISEVSNESAHGVEEVVQAAEELEDLTGNLRNLTDKFVVDGAGPADRSETASPGTGVAPGNTVEETGGDGAVQQRRPNGV